MCRYSQQDLFLFRENIEHELKESGDVLKKLRPRRRLGDKDYRENSSNIFDAAQVNRDDSIIALEIARIERYIYDLEIALLRVKNGTYGVCRRTGKLIPRERLLVNPIATLLVEEKMTERHEQKKRMRRI